MASNKNLEIQINLLAVDMLLDELKNEFSTGGLYHFTRYSNLNGNDIAERINRFKIMALKRIQERITESKE